MRAAFLAPRCRCRCSASWRPAPLRSPTARRSHAPHLFIAIMQQRTFAFQGSGPSVEIRLWCRQPPEAQAGRTLTWQINSGSTAPRGGQQVSGGAPSAAAAAANGRPPAAAAEAPEADPDLIGLDIWPASIALCRYLVNHPELVAGQRVLELGAGRPPGGL